MSSPPLYARLRPFIFALAPEAAHRLTLLALRLGPAFPAVLPASVRAVLRTRVWGRDFVNPLGLAAGFDKDAEVADSLLRSGFGFVEVGSVTPRPQSGNPKPRVFRLPEDRALINRLGFNSAGLARVEANLRRRRAAAPEGGVIGVNLGRNKDSTDAGADYLAGLRALAPLADYLVINVSSPNTPGLRALQGRDQLAALLAPLRAALDEAGPQTATGRPPPLLLKIAPDLTAEDRADIAEVALARGLDGLIVSNTTIARPPELASRFRGEAGGLSGAPLFPPSTALLAEMYRLTGGRLPIIGVGGVAGGAEAYAKIRAGASLVQLYTGLVYEGPGLMGRILTELAALLRGDGFGAVGEAVGADHPDLTVPERDQDQDRDPAVERSV